MLKRGSLCLLHHCYNICGNCRFVLRLIEVEGREEQVDKNRKEKS